MMKRQQFSTLRKEIEELVKFQKAFLLPSRKDLKYIDITIGITPGEEGFSWGYQTGDNSYTGGAYGHPHWVVLHVTRKSNCRELAMDAIEQLKCVLI